MVEKITLFELHLDGAKFGTNDDVEETPTVETLQAVAETGRDGPGVGRLLAASLFVSVVATVLARRLFGDDDTSDPIEIETDEYEADIEIEQ